LNARNNYGPVLFLLAYSLCMLDAIVLEYSTFSEFHYASLFSKGLLAAAFLLVLVKLFLDRFYDLSCFLHMAVIGLVLLVTFLRSGYYHVYYLLIVFLGIRNIRPKDLLEVDFRMKAALILFVVLSSATTVIGNYITQRTGSSVLRFSMGFNHPNTLASLMMGMIFEEAVLSERKVSWTYTMVLWAIGLGLFLITSNRTAVLLIFLFPVCLLSLHERSDDPSAARSTLLMQLQYPLYSAFSFLCMEYSRKIRFFSWIDRALSNRYYNSLRLFRKYGLSLFGQKVKLVSVRAARATSSSIALLDVAYLRMLIQSGPLAMIVYAYLYARYLRTAVFARDRRLCLVTGLFFLFGICESGFNNVFLNFTLLFAAASAYRSADATEEAWT